MKADEEMIQVEVAYAAPQHQQIVSLRVASGTTALQAIRQSGICNLFPTIDIDTAAVGIFSRLLDGKSVPLPQDYVLHERDRVEIYRPLQLDPMQVRLLRAARARKAKSKR